MTERKFKHQHAEPTRIVSPTTDHNCGDSWDSIHSPSGYAKRAKRLRLKTAATLLAMSAAALLAGCGIAALAGAAGAVPATKTESKGVPKYDVDPQVIYRIDDHRYVTMENYPDCKFENYVSGNQEVYYHDDKLGIKTRLGTNRAAYQGKLIIAAPEGKNLAFPGVPWGVCTYNDKGCSVYIGYSTDSGRTWNGIKYMQYARDPSESKDYTIVVTDDALYIRHAKSDPIKHPMGTQWSSGWGPGLGAQDFGTRLHAALSKARPADIPQEAIDDEWRYLDKLAKQVPQEDVNKFTHHLWDFRRQVAATVPPTVLPAGIRTPSKMDHFVCDSSITPRSVTYIQPASAH